MPGNFLDLNKIFHLSRLCRPHAILPPRIGIIINTGITFALCFEQVIHQRSTEVYFFIHIAAKRYKSRPFKYTVPRIRHASEAGESVREFNNLLEKGELLETVKRKATGPTHFGGIRRQGCRAGTVSSECGGKTDRSGYSVGCIPHSAGCFN
jgi:hypothetical protein